MAALPGSGYLWRSSALSGQDQHTMVHLLPSSLLQRIFPQLAAAPAESSTTTTSATPGSGSSSRSASPASGYGSKTRRSSTDSQLTLWPSSDNHSSKWMPEDPFLEEQKTPRSTSSRRDWRRLWRWVNSVLRAAIVLMAIHGVWMQVTWHRGYYMPTPHYTRNDIAQAGFIRQPLEFERSPSSSDAVTKGTRRTPTSVDDFANLSTAPHTPDEQHVLILSPLRNAEPTLSAFFSLLATLEHPRAQTSLGFLIGDEEDATGSLIADWIKEQAEKGEYRHISLIRKDFGLDSPKGNARHLKWVQPQRRSLMAKARTLLLTSTLRPDVDWVLWLDSDLAFAPPSLVSDLLRYGGAGVGGADLEDTTATISVLENQDQLPADVIVPNVMKHHKGPSSVQAYDWNSWTETRKSLAMRSKLDPEQILAEGDPSMPTYRTHLVHEWTRPNVSASWDSTSPLFPYHQPSSDPSHPISNLHDQGSPAWIGQRMLLDGVGGVSTLVRADVHRFGAVFPSWPVDNEVETEGFGVLSRKLGARVVGLPNYLVWHAS